MASVFEKFVPQDVSNDDPWLDDVLGRKSFADMLEAAIAGSSAPLVIAVHGAYGSGKSFLLKRMHASLAKREVPSVFFNAWETDYEPVPLTSFAAAISHQFAAQPAEIKTQSERVLRAAGRFAMRLAPRFASALTAGVVQATDLEGAVKDAAEAIGRTIEDTGTQAIEEHLTRQDAMAKVQSELTQLALRVRETVGENGPPKLIIFVDELDRCRPDHAISILETIKHFFSVPHVVFVIAMDRLHLRESITAVFGSGVDLHGYIRKFIDFELDLPEFSASAYTAYLLKQLNIRELFANDQRGQEKFSNIDHIFHGWMKELALPLRTQEQILAQARFVYSGLGGGKQGSIYFIIISLLCLRAASPIIYDKIVSGQITALQLPDVIAELLQSKRPLGPRTGDTALLDVLLGREKGRSDCDFSFMFLLYALGASEADVHHLTTKLNTDSKLSPRDRIRTEWLLARVGEAIQVPHYDGYGVPGPERLAYCVKWIRFSSVGS